MGLKLLIACFLALLLAACAATGEVIAATSASGDRQALAEYPRELHGLWMPKEMGCPTPINYDSEVLLSIDAGMLGQYENTSKPLRVEQTAQQPPTWRILSTFSPGTGEYEEEGAAIYTLKEDVLTVENGSASSAYVKCAQQARPVDAEDGVEYPQALRGQWSLGPEPCRAPISPDADGKLLIEARTMDGYETTSKPIRVASAPGKTNEWLIASIENYLGSQSSEEEQRFALHGDSLTVQGDGYTETYRKCPSGVR